MASSLKSASKKVQAFTHEGGLTTKTPSAKEELARTVSCCMLWEDSFYEDGVSIAQRIKDLVPQVKPQDVAALAVHARTKLNLRHAPLMLAREMARLPEYAKLLPEVLPQVVLRADELAEFLAMYWKEGRCPVSHAVRKGLSKSFHRFSEYDLAKYNRDKDVKLRDVLRVVHPVPANEEQSAMWKRLKEGTLATPVTWEVELSKPGADKKAVWTVLLQEKKLGGLALLRNLRNMQEAGIDRALVKSALTTMRTDRILPYRFIAAAKYAPHFEPVLESAMIKCIAGAAKLPGSTALLVDVSGSMQDMLSAKSDMSRLDAACGLAILLREICGEDLRVYAFTTNVETIPLRRGFALRDAIGKPRGGTSVGACINQVFSMGPVDRMIVITDEQSSDHVSACPAGVKGYIVNVGTNQNGVGYTSGWKHVSGWSEATTAYIASSEGLDVDESGDIPAAPAAEETPVLLIP